MTKKNDQFDSSLGMKPPTRKWVLRLRANWDGVKHPVQDGVEFISTCAGFFFTSPLCDIGTLQTQTTDSRRTMRNLCPDFDGVRVVIQPFCHSNYLSSDARINKKKSQQPIGRTDDPMNFK